MLSSIFAMKHFENLTFSLHGIRTVLQRSFEAQKRKNRSDNKLARGRSKYEDFLRRYIVSKTGAKYCNNC